MGRPVVVGRSFRTVNSERPLGPRVTSVKHEGRRVTYLRGCQNLREVKVTPVPPRLQSTHAHVHKHKRSSEILARTRHFIEVHSLGFSTHYNCLKQRVRTRSWRRNEEVLLLSVLNGTQGPGGVLQGSCTVGGPVLKGRPPSPLSRWPTVRLGPWTSPSDLGQVFGRSHPESVLPL